MSNLTMLMLDEVVRAFSHAVKEISPKTCATVILSCECHSEPIMLCDNREPQKSYADAIKYARDMLDKLEKSDPDAPNATHEMPEAKQ